MRKHKSVILAMAIILAIATIASASTFAWYTAQDTRTNEFRNQQWNVEGIRVGEKFIPPTDWDPNSKVEKLVWGVNVSENPVLVRASFAEMLLKLTGATPALVDDKWDDDTASDDTEFGYTVVPALFSTDSFVTWAGSVPTITSDAASKGWKILNDTNLTADSGTGKIFNTGTAMPASGWPSDVVVLYKALSATNLATGEITYDVEFMAFTTPLSDSGFGKYDGKSQGVAIGDALTIAVDSTTGLLDLNFDASELKFKQLTMTLTADKWADLDDFADPPYDLLDATADIVFGTGNIVAAPIDALIKLYFAACVFTDLTDCGVGDWWFNEADGFLYYIDIVQSGDSTNPYLEYVELDQSAGNIYSDLAYDLHVFIEGIQPMKEALEFWLGQSGNMTAPEIAAVLTWFSGLGLNLG